VERSERRGEERVSRAGDQEEAAAGTIYQKGGCK
jgi:hypothetical protein